MYTLYLVERFHASAMMLDIDQNISQAVTQAYTPTPSPWASTVKPGDMIYDDLGTVASVIDPVQAPEKDLFRYVAKEFLQGRNAPGFAVNQQMVEMGFDNELHVYHNASHMSYYFKVSELKFK